MAETANVTALVGYAEIMPPATAQNTALLAYAEVQIIATAALVTGLLAYAEVQVPYPTGVTGRTYGPAVQCM